MPIRNNNRVFYASQKVGIKADATSGNYGAIHGVQDVSVSTNFNLEQVFELGQLSIFENIENIPDVEITMTRVLDGNVPAYLHATQTATNPSLTGRQNEKCVFGLGIYTDTEVSTAASTNTVMESSGCFVSSITYEIPVDGNATESLTLVSNDKIWKGDSRIVNPDDSARASALPTPGTLFLNDSPPGSGGVSRRENVLFAYTTGSGTDVNGMVADAYSTILPPDIDGISSNGTNQESVAGKFDAHIQSITFSVDLGRTPINELGRRSQYHRFADFPVEVTTAIEVVTTSGDFVSATEGGILTTDPGAACTDAGNLTDRTIRVRLCEGSIFYAGVKNKLASITHQGGGVDGGNVTVTYNFSNFNDFTVIHEQEGTVNSTANSENWWDRAWDYVVDFS